MAYNKLVEDQRIDAPAPDDPADEGAYIELQDQLRGVLKARWHSHFPAGYQTTGGADWVLNQAGTTFKLLNTVANAIWITPICGLRVGEKITGISVWISGDATQTGGSVYLYHGLHAAALTGVDVTNGVANPWAVGTGAGNATEYNTLGANITISENYIVLVRLVAGGLAAKTHEIWDVKIRTQFGN
jgi:hypothetical protein